MEGRALWRRRPGGLLDGRGAPARRGSAAHEERRVRGQRRRRRLEVDVLDVDLGRDALGLVGLAVLGDDVGARRRAEQRGAGDDGCDDRQPRGLRLGVFRVRARLGLRLWMCD